MAAPKVSFLASIANVLFAQRHADAQKKLWELCTYGVEAKVPGDKTLAERIGEQLKRGAKVDARNSDGDTPLMVLCRRPLELQASCLIEAGADTSAVNNKGETAFLLAATAGNGGIVMELLSRGANPLATDAQGRNAAYLMVHAPADFKDNADKGRQAAGLSMLLKSGLALDDHLKMAVYSHRKHLLAVSEELSTTHALGLSAGLGDAQNVKLLLDLGIKPDAPAQFRDNTPLCAAAAIDHADMMEALLDAGADINLKSPKTHRTPLQTAVRSASREAFALLLDRGAAIDGKMELLELARDSGSKDIMRDVYDAMIDRGIMKTEVNTAKVSMKSIKLKTPGAV